MYTKVEYILFYLRVLNQNRAKLLSIRKDVYDAIKQTMIDILNKCNEVDLQNSEIEQYYEILQVIIALSQAFHSMSQTETFIVYNLDDRRRRDLY